MSNSISFDRAADIYDQSRGFPAGVADAAMKTLADFGGLGAASRVLEVGVGTGRIALPLAKYVHSIIGVDLSVAMMERLRQKRNGEAVQVVQGDATRLPLPDHSFDAAVVVHVFHLIEPWQPAMDEIRRVLRPDGVALFGNTQSAGRQQFWDLWEQVADMSHSAENRVARRHDVIDKAVARGWERVGAGVDFPYTSHMTPRRFWQSMADRFYSRLWFYDDETLQALLVKFEAVLKERFGDLDTPIASENAFHIDALRPPQAGSARA